MKTIEECFAVFNTPEAIADMEWWMSSMKKTLATIKEARSKIPKNPKDISARWDYPQVVEHLEAYIELQEGNRDDSDELDRIEEMLERKKILPNEDWLVERSRLRMLGHSDSEIQALLVKDKVVDLIQTKRH